MPKRHFFTSNPPQLEEARQDRTAPCEHAVQFGVFIDDLMHSVEVATLQVHINRAKVLLTDHYMRLRRAVPSNHRDKTTGHKCIYQTFIEAYERIEAKELTIAPPAFSTTVVQAKPRRRRVANADPAPEKPLDAVTIGHIILGTDDATS